MKDLPRDLFRGTLLALLAGASAFLLARFAFGHLYYLSVLLPVAMMAMLLLAWLLHLKSDGLFGGAARSRSSLKQAEQNDPKQNGLFVSFNEGVLERSPSGAKPSFPLSSLVPALLWGSVLLGLAAIALYYWGGIGSRFLR